MELIRYSENQKPRVAFALEDWEQKLIAKCIKPEIKKLEKKIKAIEEHPNNEGQAKYSMAIREHRLEINGIQELIKYLS